MLTLLVELALGIPLALVCIAFVVVLAAFTYPRFALWLEARTVPRWPRTKGWFYDETRERDGASTRATRSEPRQDGAGERAPLMDKNPFGRVD